jgi:hypothetical protein
MNSQNHENRLPRRRVLQWFAAVAAAEGTALSTVLARQSAPAPEGYGQDPVLVKSYDFGEVWPLTLEEGEKRTTEALAEVVFPQDDLGPAASEVRVADFIDEWVSAPYPRQQGDRRVVVPGLKALEDDCQERFKTDFASLSDRQKATLCDEMAKGNPFFTWIMMDGPVDAIWIEDLNTVLDDNKILTLANGDRMPMTDMCKIMFEVETLKNASPATVSRAGIIYCSDTDLDWGPVAEGIIRLRPENQRATLRAVVEKYMGNSDPLFPGILFNYIIRNLKPTQESDRVGLICSAFDLLSGLIDNHGDAAPPVKLVKDSEEELAKQLERVFLYSVAWGVTGLLDSEDRAKLDGWLRGIDDTFMPTCGANETIFEYFLDESANWAP